MTAVVIISALVFIISISNTEAAKILAYYPTPSISHQVVFRPLTNELVKRGHEVTVITADPEYSKGETPGNLTEVDVHDISYKIWKEQFLTSPAGKAEDLNNQAHVIFRLMNEIIEKQFLTDEVKRVLNKNNKYDLIIAEAYPRQLLVLPHIFKAPLIQFSSLGAVLSNYHYIGAHVHELLYPTVFRQRLHHLTMLEKIQELFEVTRINLFYDQFECEENKMLKRVFGNDIPPISELANNIDLMFLNTHPMWEGIRPVPPNVVFIYGIHEKPEKELPKGLKKYLDTSKNGVIFISFGTNVNPSALPPERINVLVKVMSVLPYDVLWKWDKNELAGKSENIKLSKWLPQSDLLRHPKIKLFITQGGLQSTDEAIKAGVPLLGIPMIADQWFNVEQYVYHKIGLRIDMESLTEESLKNAVNTLIEDESFRRNVQRFRSIMHDQPQTPLERATWWTEYVLRHKGAKHLRSPSANLHWTEYFEIDLVLTLLAGFVFILFILIAAFFYLCKILKKLCINHAKAKIN